MQDSAQVSSNTTPDSGGGVYVGGNDNGRGDYARGTFILQGSASVSGNTSAYGGGVYVSGGIFAMQDNTQVSGNTATYNGGGVCINYYVSYVDSMKTKTAVTSGTITKTGGTIYGDDADQKLKNTAISRMGHTMYDGENKLWRNAGAGPNINSDSYGFWPNDGDVVIFPSGFTGRWQRSNFYNMLTLTENTMKSSSSNYENNWNGTWRKQ